MAKSTFNKSEFMTLKDTMENFNEENVNTVKWYNKFEDIPPSKIDDTNKDEWEKIYNEADMCYKNEVTKFTTKKSKTDSDYQWLNTISKKGTIADKIAAHVVTIQNNPVTSLENIRILIGMVKVAKRKECMQVIDSLTELFLEILLRKDEKLRHFSQQPISQLTTMSSQNLRTRRRILNYWYFEHELKKMYAEFIEALTSVAHDSIENNKEKTISAICKLLNGNPEQEKKLLTNMVNKLGDPSPKIVSKVIYALGQIIYNHPFIQSEVLKEVEQIVFRPNITMKTQYYAMCFLSQFHLDAENSDVAHKLVEVYLAFFKLCVAKGEINSRMMSALLVGVNRAYPYVGSEKDSLVKQHLDTMYRIVYEANFNISLHALGLLLQVCNLSNTNIDKFYSALYKKLSDPCVLNTTHHAILLNLIYKALLKDANILRIKVFIKRLLELALLSVPSFACGILFLVSQITHKRRGLHSFKIKSFHEFDGKDMQSATALNKNKNGKPDQVIKDETRQNSQSNISDTTNCTFTPNARNPLHAGGEYCYYSELIYLQNHFHPSVVTFASNILNGDKIKYSGDPLKDFTLVQFLDRFVFKNPKTVTESNKSINSIFGQRKLHKPRGIKSLPVTSTQYINQSAKSVPADELFLHTFVQRKYKDRSTNNQEDDLESVGSNEFDEILNEFTSNSNDQLDFLSAIGPAQQNKKKNKKILDNNNDDDDYDDDDDIDDDNSDSSDADLSYDNVSSTISSKRNKRTQNKIVQPAIDELSSILDDEGSSLQVPGSSSSLQNKDSSSNKQIAWEQKRNSQLWRTKKNTFRKRKGSFQNNTHSRGKKRKT